MKRIDVHAPSRIIPADYEYVAIEMMKVNDFGDCAVVIAERKIIEAHLLRTGGTYSNHDHGGNCDVCGAHCIYTVLFYHAPTNSYVRMGNDCAAKMDIGDDAAFRRFKASVDAAREAVAGKRKAAALLTDAGLAKAWELYVETDQDKLVELGACVRRVAKLGEYRDEYRNEVCTTGELVIMNRQEFTTLRDMIGNVVKYGNVSDKQIKYIAVLVERIVNAKAIDAQRAAEKLLAADVVEGRIAIAGIVLKVEEREDFRGATVWKMTVKDDRGFIVWGTQPGSLSSADRGDRVEFVGTVTKSDRDAKFGFFKRPSKAKLVAQSKRNA